MNLDMTNDAVLEECAEGTDHSDNSPVPIDTSVRRRLQAFDIYSMLASDTGYYHYDGGLTTLPCSETVAWNLADTPINISVLQYTRLMNLILETLDDHSCVSKTVADPNTGSTSRPPVPLGDRTIQRVCPKAAEPAPTAAPVDTTSAASFPSILGTFAVSAVATALLLARYNICLGDPEHLFVDEQLKKEYSFHLHASTEHIIDGSHFGAELHVVHQQVWEGETRLAVVGMIFEPNNNKNNPLFQTLLSRCRRLVSIPWRVEKVSSWPTTCS
jgi:hypothetical protein